VRVLPSGWSTIELGEALLEPLANGRSVPDRPGGFPVLRLTAVRDRRIDLEQCKAGAWSENEARPYLVREGDLLIVRGNGSLHLVGRAGVVGAVTAPVAYPDTLIRVRTDPALIESRYMSLLWDSPAVREQIEDSVRTTAGIYKVNQSQLRSVQLPIPSLDEQRRIVDILEDHLSRLDAADAYLGASHRRTDRLASAALWGLTHGRTDSRVCTLSDVAEVRLGRQRSPSNHTGSRMRRYLRAGNVGWDALRLDDVKEMNFTAAEETIYRLLPGDILVVEASGSASEVGKSAIYDGEPDGVCFQNTLLRVRCSDAVPEFLQKYLLAEAIAGRFAEGSRGVGINHLGRAKLAGWTLELASEDDQRTLAAQCAQALETMAALKSDVTDARTRSATLRRALLAAAFSGRLTGRASDMDLAEELVS